MLFHFISNTITIMKMLNGQLKLLLSVFIKFGAVKIHIA